MWTNRDFYPVLLPCLTIIRGTEGAPYWGAEVEFSYANPAARDDVS